MNPIQIAQGHRGQVLNSYFFSEKVEARANLSPSFLSIPKHQINLQPR